MRPAWMSSACDSQGRMRTYSAYASGTSNCSVRISVITARRCASVTSPTSDRRSRAHGAVLVVGVVEPALLLGALGRHRGARLARQPDVVAEPVVLRRRRGVLRRAGDGPGEQRGKHRAQQDRMPSGDHVTEHTALPDHRPGRRRPGAQGTRDNEEVTRCSRDEGQDTECDEAEEGRRLAVPRRQCLEPPAVQPSTVRRSVPSRRLQTAARRSACRRSSA